jgi:hypothetical protein
LIRTSRAAGVSLQKTGSLLNVFNNEAVVGLGSRGVLHNASSTAINKERVPC